MSTSQNVADVSHMKLKQPEVFSLAYFTTLFERFGFYVLSFLLVLYVKSQNGMSDAQAFTLFGVFTAIVFLTPAFGGYLADNIIGIRRCIIWGLLLEGAGLILLALPYSPTLLAIALSLVIIGVGLFKTAPTDLLGRSYKEGDPRIDSGFTLYYMAINIGSLFSSLVAGYMQQYYGWHITFLIGGIGLYLGLIFYFFLRKPAKKVDSEVGLKRLSLLKWLAILTGMVISTVFCIVLLLYTSLANLFLVAATVVTFGYFIYEMIRSTKHERMRIAACLYLIIVGMAFSILYFQGFTSIELFIDRCVVKHIFGFNIPTVVYLSLNPFFVIVLGPILAYIYGHLAKLGKDWSVITKLTVGLLGGSLGFFVMAAGKYFGNDVAQISSWFIVGMFFLYTIGDLMNSALGVAMVTHIAPKRMYGVMMGTWFLVGNSLAAALSGLFAGLANVPEGVKDPHVILNIYTSAFWKLGIGGVAVSLIAFMINPYIKRIIN
jgi:proton-dependent oligopeptide transporter, POT family